MKVTTVDESEYTKLSNESKRLSNEIAIQERRGLKAYDLKKEYHKIKLQMIDILDNQKALKTRKTFRQLKDEVRSRPPIPRFETGIPILDHKLIGGFEAGTFVQLAGISGGGKTTLASKILTNVANGGEVVFFNFEMNDKRIVDRLEKELSDKGQDNLIVHDENRDLDDICNTIRLEAKDGVKFFLIDSMMKIRTKKDNVVDEQVEISDKLSQLTKEENIILILINQQSEDALKNNRLSLKGSNAQMYDADIVLFLTPKDEHTRVLSCRKNRQDEYLFTIEMTIDDVRTKKPTETEIAYQVETISAPVI